MSRPAWAGLQLHNTLPSVDQMLDVNVETLLQNIDMGADMRGLKLIKISSRNLSVLNLLYSIVSLG